MVGEYDGHDVYEDGDVAMVMQRDDRKEGHTAKLLANLERERVPPRRPIRTVRWYEGNGDD